MSDENSATAGTKSRRTLRNVKTKFHTRRAVINIVPTKASSAAFSAQLDSQVVSDRLRDFFLDAEDGCQLFRPKCLSAAKEGTF
jgi:hypothetical protein